MCVYAGGGSGSVVPSYIVSPLEGLRTAWGLAPPPPVSNNCSEGHFLVGMDYDNQVKQTMKPAPDVATCCRFCANNPDCEAFSWTHAESPGAQRCFMKGAATDLTANAGVTAGICAKTSPPGPPSMVTYTPGFDDLAGAAAAAKAAEVAVVFVGTLSHEGGDRASLSLDDGGPKNNQNALIEAVAAANPNTVVVMAVPGAVLMPWSSKVKAIVTNFMPGQQAGHAMGGDQGPARQALRPHPESCDAWSAARHTCH